MKGDTRVDCAKYELPADSKVWCANHPVLAHKLTKLRDERTDSTVFRHVLREVTFYLGYAPAVVDAVSGWCIGLMILMALDYSYEATYDLNTAPKQIKVSL